MASLINLILNNNFKHLSDEQIVEAFDMFLEKQKQLLTPPSSPLPEPPSPATRHSDLGRAESTGSTYYEIPRRRPVRHFAYGLTRAENGWRQEQAELDAEYDAYMAYQERLEQEEQEEREQKETDELVELKDDESPIDDRGCSYCNSTCECCAYEPDNYDGYDGYDN